MINLLILFRGIRGVEMLALMVVCLGFINPIAVVGVGETRCVYGVRLIRFNFRLEAEPSLSTFFLRSKIESSLQNVLFLNKRQEVG